MQQKGGGGKSDSGIFRLAGRLDSRGGVGVWQLRSFGAKVCWHCAVMVSRCVGVETPFTYLKN